MYVLGYTKRVRRAHADTERSRGCAARGAPGIQQRLLLAPVSEHDVVRILEPDSDRDYAPGRVGLASDQIDPVKRLFCVRCWCRLAFWGARGTRWGRARRGVGGRPSFYAV